MQLSVPDEGGEFMIYESKFGAQQMKESIIRQVKRVDSSTPNPISQDQYLTSKGLAVMAASDVPEDMRLRMMDSSMKVIGIGGVHYYSIRDQTRVEDKYTIRDVRQAIIKRLDLTDDEIGGDYAETDLSNLIMVDGFMEHLNISEVYPLSVNMTDGVLLNLRSGSEIVLGLANGACLLYACFQLMSEYSLFVLIALLHIQAPPYWRIKTGFMGRLWLLMR